MALPLYTALVLLASTVGMAVALFTWLLRDTPGAAPLTLFLIGASLWAFAEGLGLASPGLTEKLFWAKMQFSVSTLPPLAWLLTVLTYTGRESWLRWRNVALLVVEPVVFIGLVWTNGIHGLIWKATNTVTVAGTVVLEETYAVATWGHLAYSYTLIAVGAFLLVRLILRTNEFFRSQGTALLVAIFVPMMANAMTFFSVLPPGIDLTSVGFVISGLVLAAAIFRQDLLELTPVTRELGREQVIDDLDDQILIVDENERVVDANPAARKLLDDEGVVGASLSTVLPEVAELLDDDPTATTDVELELDGSIRYYSVSVSSLYRGYGTLTGQVISLRDVTERRQREQRLDVLYRLLRHNVRNEMNVVRGNAELLERDLDDSHQERLDRIKSTVDRVITRSEKIGRLSRALEAERVESLDLSAHLDEIADTVGFRFPETTVELDVPDGLYVQGGPSLTVAFEELLMNAFEHNDADEPRVRVVATEIEDGRKVAVRVADNGPGITDHERSTIVQERETPLEHSSGVGLWLVNWIVNKAGGTLGFEVDDGTTVVVTLPTADETDAADADEESVRVAESGENGDADARDDSGGSAAGSAND